MAGKRANIPRAKMSPEVKRAYAQVEKGVRGIGKSIADIQQGLRKAERKVETDARARIRGLRDEVPEHSRHAGGAEPASRVRKNPRISSSA